MATCRAIVNGALRKIGRLGGGREARPADLQDTLDALKAMYRMWINAGAFGRLADVTPTIDYIAIENVRIFRNSSNTLQITLPETISENGINRTPMDCSVVVVIDAFTGSVTEFIYDGQTKAWTSLYGLTVDGEAPLSRRGEQGLMACLAVQIADEFGGNLGQATLQQASSFQTALTHRYSVPATLGETVYF